MTRANIIWLVCIMIFASCKQKSQPGVQTTTKTDTLAYSYKNIEEHAADCGNKPDSACATAKITSLVFTDQATLNDSIQQRLIYLCSGEKPATSLEMAAKEFIQGSPGDSTSTTNTEKMPYELDAGASVVRQDPGLVTIQIDEYAFSGGAHGNNYTEFLNWDTQSNKKVALDDILNPGSKGNLTAIAEKVFRKQEKLSETRSLADYFFKDGKFALNNNFLITPVGIRFLYNDYEIKAYSEGPTELLIPYAQIKTLLRPNTVVSQYIK